MGRGNPRGADSIVGRLSDPHAIPRKTRSGFVAGSVGSSGVRVARRDDTIHSLTEVCHEVVDVLLGKEVLRVGAEVTDKTKLTAAGKAVSLEAFLPSMPRREGETRRVLDGSARHVVDEFERRERT